MDKSYSFEEQETTINMYPAQMCKYAEIFSCIPHMIKRLKKLAGDYPSDVVVRECDGCVFATVPMEWVKIAPKRKTNLTEEQRKAINERLSACREAKRNDAT